MCYHASFWDEMNLLVIYKVRWHWWVWDLTELFVCSSFVLTVKIWAWMMMTTRRLFLCPMWMRPFWRKSFNGAPTTRMTHLHPKMTRTGRRGQTTSVLGIVNFWRSTRERSLSLFWSVHSCVFHMAYVCTRLHHCCKHCFSSIHISWISLVLKFFVLSWRSYEFFHDCLLVNWFYFFNFLFRWWRRVEYSSKLGKVISTSCKCWVWMTHDVSQTRQTAHIGIYVCWGGGVVVVLWGCIFGVWSQWSQEDIEAEEYMGWWRGNTWGFTPARKVMSLNQVTCWHCLPLCWRESGHSKLSQAHDAKPVILLCR